MNRRDKEKINAIRSGLKDDNHDFINRSDALFLLQVIWKLDLQVESSKKIFAAAFYDREQYFKRPLERGVQCQI